jgi:hypothetical protein
VSKLGREAPSWIRAWSLIRNEKPIVLFERHCHATEKSEAGQGGGEAQGVSDPQKFMYKIRNSFFANQKM